MNDELLRLNAAADLIGVAPKTIKKYCRCELLRCVKLPSGHWRVWKSSLDEIRLVQTDPNRKHPLSTST